MFWVKNVEWSRHRADRRLIASSNPTPARYGRRPCGVARMPIRTLMVEYSNKWDFQRTGRASMLDSEELNSSQGPWVQQREKIRSKKK